MRMWFGNKLGSHLTTAQGSELLDLSPGISVASWLLFMVELGGLLHLGGRSVTMQTLNFGVCWPCLKPPADGKPELLGPGGPAWEEGQLP